MKPIVCNLPEFLIEKNLKKAFQVNSKINRNKKVSFTSLKIDGIEWELTDLKSNKVFFNWKNVKYFDNAGILTLLTAQYYLLELGILITNFNENTKIGCNKFVKRALDAFGYFSQFLSGRFQLPIIEKYFISNINYIENIPPLEEYSEILPIISCKTQTSILKGSSEDKVIKEYEDNMSIRMFIHQDKKMIKRRKIIENGEFGHLIIRQCRKNVIEHSKSDIAFSCAQILRKRDIGLSWGLSYEEITGKIDKNLETIFKNYPDDMPILDLTTIDNGIGIPETLNDIWDSIILYGEKKVEAKSRVNKITPGWSTNEKLITFAMDSDGSCKIDLNRSNESPGLYKIKDLVHTENGFLEISSNSAKILYTKNKKWEQSKHNNSFSHGTLVRILIPLFEITPTETEKIHNNIKKEKFDHLHIEAPQEIINLHYWWIKIKNTSDNIKESIKHFVNLIILEVRRIVEKPQVKTILLNWENLSWSDHYISNFFDELRINLLENRKLKPIIHINVPKEYLLLGEVAISKYKESLSLITLVFFEGNSNWTWIGVPKIPNDFSDSNTSIGKELNNILTNNRPYSVRTLGTRSRDLIRQCLNECSLFKEQKGTDKDGSIKFLGRYEPVQKISEIQAKIASTFNTKLVRALNSKYCMLNSDNLPSNDKTKKLFIKLTNGKFVNVFYRCDGLLNYTPINEDNYSANDERQKFQNELVAYLVDIAKRMENATPGKFDLVVSCTSPTHWFVHQIADGLSDNNYRCGHFVAKRHTLFQHEFRKIKIKKGSKALIFTDVMSTGIVANTMINELIDAEVKIGGLLAIVDTRTSDEKNKCLKEKLPINNVSPLICLTHLPVQKFSNKYPGWILDPETLEPEPFVSIENYRIENEFEGVGPLSLNGKVASKLLQYPGVTKYKHYKHGSHHSEFVCDIRNILNRKDIKTIIGGRLNLYIDKCGFDLIVYPNHSNAYLLFNMVNNIRGSELPLPPSQIALCRYVGNERTYFLQENYIIKKPQKILIIDDGIVTGGTIKSIISTLINNYPSTIQEIHFVVFINEMSGVKSNYWSKIGGCASETFFMKDKIRRKMKGTAFLNPTINFSAFISFPHTVYDHEYCPLCRQQELFKQYSEDKLYDIHERLFYADWAEDLRVKDIYHNMESYYQKGLLKGDISQNQKSFDAINILKFNLLLQKEIDVTDLIDKMESNEYTDFSRIFCLRSLLHIKDTALTKKQRDDVLYRANRLIRETNYKYALLVLKVFIWEHPTFLKLNDFIDVLISCSKFLHRHTIIGALMAYARFSFSYTNNETKWDKQTLHEKLSKIIKNCDLSIRPSIKLLYDWLIYGDIYNLGSSVIHLKRILFSKRSHKHFKDDLDLLGEYINHFFDNKLSEDQIPYINATAVRVIQRFNKIERVMKEILKENPIKLTISESDCEKSLEFLERLTPLIEPSLQIDITSQSRNIFENADLAINQLDSDWFTPGNSYLYSLITPYIQPVFKILIEIDRKIKKESTAFFDPSKINIDYSCFERNSLDGHTIFVIHEDRVLNDFFKDIFRNFWIHAVNDAIAINGIAELIFSYEIQSKGIIEIKIKDNGPGIEQLDIKNMMESPTIEKFKTFDCSYSLSSMGKNKGTLTKICMHTTEVIEND